MLRHNRISEQYRDRWRDFAVLLRCTDDQDSKSFGLLWWRHTSKNSDKKKKRKCKSQNFQIEWKCGACHFDTQNTVTIRWYIEQCLPVRESMMNLWKKYGPRFLHHNNFLAHRYKAGTEYFPAPCNFALCSNVKLNHKWVQFSSDLLRAWINEYLCLIPSWNLAELV